MQVVGCDCPGFKDDVWVDLSAVRTEIPVGEEQQNTHQEDTQKFAKCYENLFHECATLYIGD
jgi:hypothetical protein